MIKKILFYILPLAILLPSIGWQLDSNGHHESGAELHHLAHELGQAHTHDKQSEDKLEFKFSWDAIEHVSDSQDKLAIEFVTFKAPAITQHLATTLVSQLTPQWQRPYLSYIGPPPRA